MSFTKYTLLSNPKNYGADRAASSIKYLVYHYTGNKTDKAVNNATYFKNNTVNASAHYFVDDTTVYQSVPDLTSAWAVGDNKYSDCNTTGGGTMYGKITNSNSLSIEMCSVNGEISEATMENAIALGQELMKKYNISVSNVYRHFDVSGKHCPGWAGWYGSDSSKWISFKSRLSKDVSDADTSASNNTSTAQNSSASANVTVSTNTSASATTSASTASKELYRVRKTWSDVSGQLGAFYSLENAKNACINGYSVFDSNGNIVYTNTSNTSDTSNASTSSATVTDNSPSSGTTSASNSASNSYNSASNSTSSSNTLTVNAYYRAYANGKWYPQVKNLEDYAGDSKNAIRGVAIKTDNGSVKYRVHIRGGGWYPYVTGYNINDISNGYAGDCKNDIDMIEVYYNTPSGFAYKKAKYRVAPVGKNYYDWQYDNETTNGCDGYAGTSGVSIGKFQIIIE